MKRPLWHIVLVEARAKKHHWVPWAIMIPLAILISWLIVGCAWILDTEADWVTWYRGVEITGADCEEHHSVYIPEAKQAIDDVLDYYGLAKFPVHVSFQGALFMRNHCQTVAYTQIPQHCTQTHGGDAQVFVLCQDYWRIKDTFRDEVAAGLIKWVRADQVGDPTGMPWDAICQTNQAFADLGVECVFEDPNYPPWSIQLKGCACDPVKAMACGYPGC